MFCKLWEGLRRQHGPVLLLVAMTAGAALIVPSHASAQAVTGTLLGNVTDSSGAGVPGATVTVTEVQTNISRSAVSNDAGYFIFASLQNGTYTVDAELTGFKKVVRQNVKVDVNTTIRVDMKLEVGQLTEAVTVSAETPVLQTDRTDTGRILESKMVSEMPLTFNRNFQSLLIVVPGSTRPHREHSAFFNSQDSLAVEINGQPRQANNTLIEGLDNNHKTGLLQVIIPAADALETVSISTSNYDAEFGRAGGAVTNVTLKSGTNDLKGSLFFFGNTDKTNASDYFTHLKAPTKFANGGFTLGGPIVRSKLFFFGDYQRTLDNFGYVVRATVPTLRMRNGDFGEVSQRVYDPLTGDIGGANRVAVCEQPGPAGADQPDRPQADRLHSRAQHPGRAARPEQLPEGADAREDDRRLRRQGEPHAQPEGPDVVSRELHAPGRVRSGALRHLRRAGQRRLRGHGDEHEHEHGGDLDARVQRHDRARRARRPELLPQRHEHRRATG